MDRLCVLLIFLPLVCFASDDDFTNLGSPEATAGAHMKALMTRDASTIERTLFFPFVHIRPNGEKFFIRSIDEFPSQGVSYYSELDSAKVIALHGQTALVEVVLRVHDLDKNPLFRSTAVWGMIKVGDRWLVSWRQLLGRLEEEKK